MSRSSRSKERDGEVDWLLGLRLRLLLRRAGLARRGLLGYAGLSNAACGRLPGRSGRLFGTPALVEAGGDDGHVELVLHALVDDGAEDDIGFGVGVGPDHLSGLVDLEQAEVVAALDIEENALRAFDRHIQQGALNRLLGGLPGRGFHRWRGRWDIRAAPPSSMMERTSAKSRLIRPGTVISSLNALNTLPQHVVGDDEGFTDGGGFVEDMQEPVVRDGDQRINGFAEAAHGAFGYAAALRAFECERLGDDADCQRA